MVFSIPDLTRKCGHLNVQYGENPNPGQGCVAQTNIMEAILKTIYWNSDNVRGRGRRKPGNMTLQSGRIIKRRVADQEVRHAGQRQSRARAERGSRSCSD